MWTFTQLTRHHVLSLGCVWISSWISEALNILLFLIYLFLSLSSFFFAQEDKLFSDAHCSSWFRIKATEEQPWSRYIQGNGGDSAKGIGPVTHAIRCFQWQHISDRTDVTTVTHITYQQSSSEGFKTASDTKLFLLCLFICFFSFGSTPKTKIRQPSFSWPTILTSKLKYTAKREQIIMKWITQIQWGGKKSAWDGVFIHPLTDLINVTGVQITVWGCIRNVSKVYGLLSGLTITTPLTGSSCQMLMGAHGCIWLFGATHKGLWGIHSGLATSSMDVCRSWWNVMGGSMWSVPTTITLIVLWLLARI